MFFRGRKNTEPQFRYPTNFDNSYYWWENLENIGQVAGESLGNVSNDGSIANPSGDLYSRGYGFSIPGNAIILNLELKMSRRVIVAGKAKDFQINLLDDTGYIVGNNNSKPELWGDTNAIITYGGSSDYWGVSLTPSLINSPEFGTAIQATYVDASGAHQIYVQWLTLEVTWEI